MAGRVSLMADIKYIRLTWTSVLLNEIYRAKHGGFKKTGDRFTPNSELAARYTDLVVVILCCGVDNDPPGGRLAPAANTRGVRYHPAD
jgi:hypothetical protein